MVPANWPSANPGGGKLLVIERSSGRFWASRLDALGELVRSGDLLVANDAATFPASLRFLHRGLDLELRLLAQETEKTWKAVIMGPGDWRTDTLKRDYSEKLEPGQEQLTKQGLRFRLVEALGKTGRFVRVEFPEASHEQLWFALYREGSPIQYSYLRAPLDLWHVQTRYASRPWATEAPSAGLRLDWQQLISLERQGARVRFLTHAAGISSTGDRSVDEALPLPERSEIPADTAARVVETHASGGRVLAIGTSVARALEQSAVSHGHVRPGRATATLKLHAGHELRVVDGILTGMHDVAESHFQLLEAFVPRALLQKANQLAESEGFLSHEFGDSCLIL